MLTWRSMRQSRPGARRSFGIHRLITQRYDRRVQLEYDLQRALENHEFELLYQPIVDPRSGRAICCEALLRWNHSAQGQISPMEFIPIAEATELIVPIGAWVLAAACAEARHWPAEIKLAVNLSPVQFRRGRELVDMVKETLVSTGLPAHRLELEITESVASRGFRLRSRHSQGIA